MGGDIVRLRRYVEADVRDWYLLANMVDDGVVRHVVLRR